MIESLFTEANDNGDVGKGPNGQIPMFGIFSGLSGHKTFFDNSAYK